MIDTSIHDPRATPTATCAGPDFSVTIGHALDVFVGSAHQDQVLLRSAPWRGSRSRTSHPDPRCATSCSPCLPRVRSPPGWTSRCRGRLVRSSQCRPGFLGRPVWWWAIQFCLQISFNASLFVTPAPQVAGRANSTITRGLESAGLPSGPLCHRLSRRASARVMG